MTNVQSHDKLNRLADRINQLKLDSLNLKRKNNCRQNKNDLYKRLVLLISQDDVPRLKENDFRMVKCVVHLAFYRHDY